MRWTCKRSAAHPQTSATAGSSRRGSGLMCTLELCATQKEFGTSTARTSMHAPTATNSTGPIPNGPVFPCREAYREGRRQTHRCAENGQECDCHQHEHDQDCNGDELHAVRDKGKCGWWKGKGKGGM